MGISALLGVVLTLASLGYSQGSFYSIATTPPSQVICGSVGSGYPLPYLWQYDMCFCPLEVSCQPYASFAPVNAVVDFIVWFAIAFVVVYVLDALWTRRRRTSLAKTGLIETHSNR